MPTERAVNGRCRFGRRHSWLTNGTRIGDHSVYLCTTCGLVAGTGVKISLNTEGGLYRAADVVRAVMQESHA